MKAITVLGLILALAGCAGDRDGEATTSSSALPNAEPDACDLNLIPDPYRDVWWTKVELVPLEDGMPVFIRDAVEHDHPVALAQWGLRFHYQGAIQEMQRIAEELIAISTMEGDARLYAYSFAYDTFDGQHIEPPWYSGMAQGQVLSVMVRLAEATGSEEYAQLAHETYRGLLLETVEIGDEFWIVEYPTPITNPVLNGHAFAALGLWDYWRWSGEGDDALCRAIETLANHIQREPERAVYYDRDMTLGITANNEYRAIHQFVFQALADIRGSAVLADAAVRATH